MVARIFIVDDHDHVRRQLRSLIESQRDWTVCCEATDGQEAVDKHGGVEPHVTLMDFNMPEMDGLKASKIILARRPNAAIMMVTVFSSEQLADEARKAGVKGLCTKSEASCILQGIERLLRGETHFPPQNIH
jgi:DNA-binding NarL/FixJ family response regulator